MLRSRPAAAQAPDAADEAARIAAALPSSAPAAPRRPRRLLIFDLNVGYGGHGSIRTANAAFALMGQRTGAFEAEVHRNPAIFSPGSLAKFDAVFFNNTVGNLFEDPALRRSLAEFVYAGGGLMGVHGTSVAFTRWPGAHEDWPEFGRMLGARGASHLAQDERASIAIEDPGHPLTAMFPAPGFERSDEFFRFGDPYSRHRVRVLLRIDAARTPLPEGRKPFRADNDYAVAWVRRYGRGRVFYSSIAHDPRAFCDPELLRFYLAATQFALGDLPAPTTPSAFLTPAIRAQESLGWRAGIEAEDRVPTPLSDVIANARRLGAPFVGACIGQRIFADAPELLDQSLGAASFERLRLMLDDAGATLLTLRIPGPPGDASDWGNLFAMGRRLGAETLIADSMPNHLPALGALASSHDIRLAIACERPEALLPALASLDPRVGACADFTRWAQLGIDPVAATRALGSRLITVANRDTEMPPGPSDPSVLATIRDMRLTPTMFAFASDGSRAGIAHFNNHCERLLNHP